MTSAGAIKTCAVIVAAVVINILMFTAIEYMVGMKRVRLTDTTDMQIANFIRMQEQSREVSSRRDPKAPQKPQSEVRQDVANLAQSTSALGNIGLSVEMPDIEIDVGTGGIQLARRLTPLVRIPAEYPTSALVKGTEGFVDLRFTVTETGTVEDPEVLRADPAGVFERAALRAVRKWKYQPQVVDGQPRAVITHTRIRFELAEREEP